MLTMIRGAALALAMTMLVSTGAMAQATPGALTPEQTKQVEEIFRRMIKEQPRLIIEAIQNLREQEEAAAEAKAMAAVKEKRDEILKDPAAPIFGNPDGDVTVVEFFDYRCPYCKSVAGKAMETAKKDGKVKVMFKELPILGPESVFAARAALAAQRQGRYIDFHLALMRARERLTDEITIRIAQGLGLDMEKMKKDMASPEIKRQLEANLELAQELGIRGTPAFIVGDKLAPGAIDEETLVKMIADARKK
jgi:protein-disulfide isomerase